MRVQQAAGGTAAARGVQGRVQILEPSHPHPPKNVTLEILTFRVAPGRAREFVRRNEEVWTPALRDRPGFVRREVVLGQGDEDEVVILVYWSSRRDMENFPADKLEELEAEMADLVVEQQQWVGELVVPTG